MAVRMCPHLLVVCISWPNSVSSWAKVFVHRLLVGFLIIRFSTDLCVPILEWIIWVEFLKTIQYYIPNSTKMMMSTCEILRWEYITVHKVLKIYKITSKLLHAFHSTYFYLSHLLKGVGLVGILEGWQIWWYRGTREQRHSNLGVLSVRNRTSVDKP